MKLIIVACLVALAAASAVKKHDYAHAQVKALDEQIDKVQHLDKKFADNLKEIEEITKVKRSDLSGSAEDASHREVYEAQVRAAHKKFKDLSDTFDDLEREFKVARAITQSYSSYKDHRD